MTTLNQIASKIVKEQELIIGPLAWTEASKVLGLKVSQSDHEIVFANGDQKETINRLVNQYESIFGRASREVSRNAVAKMLVELSPGDVPSSLLSI
ncbi:hypothetical protein EXS57_00565 [Candidatus Kaiserbacteria bacterium]|nr:hypothetical protein [Candidatus Kaiserbacteria bacterium]